jgi:hypothetical protein
MRSPRRARHAHPGRRSHPATRQPRAATRRKGSDQPQGRRLGQPSAESGRAPLPRSQENRRAVPQLGHPRAPRLPGNASPTTPSRLAAAPSSRRAANSHPSTSKPQSEPIGNDGARISYPAHLLGRREPVEATNYDDRSQAASHGPFPQDLMPRRQIVGPCRGGRRDGSGGQAINVEGVRRKGSVRGSRVRRTAVLYRLEMSRALRKVGEKEMTVVSSA